MGLASTVSFDNRPNEGFVPVASPIHRTDQSEYRSGREPNNLLGIRDRR